MSKNDELKDVIYPELLSLKAILHRRVTSQTFSVFNPDSYQIYFEQFNVLCSRAKNLEPNLFHLIDHVQIPKPIESSDFQGRGYYRRGHFDRLIESIERMTQIISHNLGNRRKMTAFFSNPWVVGIGVTVIGTIAATIIINVFFEKKQPSLNVTLNQETKSELPSMEFTKVQLDRTFEDAERQLNLEPGLMERKCNDLLNELNRRGILDSGGNREAFQKIDGEYKEHVHSIELNVKRKIEDGLLSHEISFVDFKGTPWLSKQYKDYRRLLKTSRDTKTRMTDILNGFLSRLPN